MWAVEATPELIKKLESQIGKKIGVSDWFLVDQLSIDIFGKVTRDYDPMHNDPDWKENPWGGPIAHGMFTVSLMPHFAAQAGFPIISDEHAVAINYGFDKVRLIAPVPIGKRIRNHMVLDSITPKGDGRYLLKTTNTVEIEGFDKPAAVLEWLCMYDFN